MKVAFLLICGAAVVAGGSVAWPPRLIRTVLPPQTKTVAYSTTQYINSLPVSYQVQPHFAYEVPQLNQFTQLHPAYYPIGGGSYFPPGSVFYPSISPVAPGLPVGSIPSFPAGIPAGQAPSAPAEQPAGDADTAVVDSADQPQQPQQDQQQPSEEPAQSQPSMPQQPPASTFPNFPTIDYPQITGDAPSFPQFPQFPGLPQFPQFPSNPLFPQNPSPSPPTNFPSPAPPSSFPGSDSVDKGLNDEDTVSVESA
ncbi:hypothetical protein ABMA27_006644 [Loxostege sticticalis]|uniref:Uncharacterized protein n=1 Tax=Loxostege sticticalis TaxID=481309 RepID=A0ABR3IJW2_LOXSC